jgi:16S rRNA (cytidine1402-2'-O)-methyltransferase
MSGTLYVVATPIGNLEDITLRALRVLRAVDVIAAEDTRRTARLLNHHAISRRTVSFHRHNARSRVPELVRRLQGGESVAIVTDAGTPGISDPGLELVQAAISTGIPVDPIPGASAPLAALIASGFPMVPFTIFGFAPNRSNARTRWLQSIGRVEHTFSFFEAPHRIRETLREAALSWGVRQIVVARELTKIHQEVLRGVASELVGRVAEPRGEFTLIVGPAANHKDQSDLPITDSELAQEFWHLTESAGTSRRDAVRRLAQRSGRSSKEVYSAIERGKKLGV